jgi:hypothetical protein
MTEQTPKDDPALYDTAAAEAGITIGTPGWQTQAEAILGFERPPGPSRNGSTRCQSGSLASGGHRTYCTCDTCW